MKNLSRAGLVVSVICGALTFTTIGAAAEPVASAAPTLVVRVDSNRDGRIDTSGASDDAKHQASALTGALFLPNLDDDAKRCRTTDEVCSDATDEVVNGAADADDLAPIMIDAMPGISRDAKATVEVTPANRVHLFVKNGDRYELVTNRTIISSSMLANGVTFGLEGLDIVRDASTWDGNVTIKVTVSGGGANLRDDVVLHQAPMLSHNHKQVEQQLIAAPQNDAAGRVFATDLKAALRTAGVPAPTFLNTRDRWVQDYVEPMYVSMPKDGKDISMRLLMRSDQYREGQAQLFKLRGSNVGVVKTAEGNPTGGTRNSFGNLETIPPHKGYPAGRIVMGFSDDDGPSRRIQTILAAQGVQNPLRLDTGWLSVGHVDEFMQFLPANTSLGFKLAVSDPRAGIALFKKAVQDGYGSKAAGQKGDLARTSLKNLVADRTFLNDQDYAADAIDSNIETLKREIGLSDSDIVRIPGMYMQGRHFSLTGNGDSAALSQIAAAGKNTEATYGPQNYRQEMGALYPMAINSIVTSNRDIAAAKQFGPVINGRDILAEAVSNAYAQAGMKVSYIDDYESYHMLDGEVHCASNSLRAIPSNWWSE